MLLAGPPLGAGPQGLVDSDLLSPLPPLPLPVSLAVLLEGLNSSGLLGTGAMPLPVPVPVPVCVLVCVPVRVPVRVLVLVCNCMPLLARLVRPFPLPVAVLVLMLVCDVRAVCAVREEVLVLALALALAAGPGPSLWRLLGTATRPGVLDPLAAAAAVPSPEPGDAGGAVPTPVPVPVPVPVPLLLLRLLPGGCSCRPLRMTVTAAAAGRGPAAAVFAEPYDTDPGDTWSSLLAVPESDGMGSAPGGRCRRMPPAAAAAITAASGPSSSAAAVPPGGGPSCADDMQFTPYAPHAVPLVSAPSERALMALRPDSQEDSRVDVGTEAGPAVAPKDEWEDRRVTWPLGARAGPWPGTVGAPGPPWTRAWASTCRWACGY